MQIIQTNATNCKGLPRTINKMSRKRTSISEFFIKYLLIILPFHYLTTFFTFLYLLYYHIPFLQALFYGHQKPHIYYQITSRSKNPVFKSLPRK